MNIFGYDENPLGQLVKQQTQMVGFTGTATDRVGPGDYDVATSEAILRKQVLGVTTWRKPEEPPELIKSIQDLKRKAPGPGDYQQIQIANDIKASGRGTSSFKSNVQRAQTAGTLSRLQLRQLRQHEVGRRSLKSFHKAGMNRAASQMSLHPKEKPDCELDSYEGDENEDTTPGPGQYYNPGRSTCFKKEPTSEKLQFFGSTVERFADGTKAKVGEVGPCSYDISHKGGVRKLARPTIYSGFTSAAQRFPAKQIDSDLPGPGQYLEAATSHHRPSKSQTKKSGIFGSVQARFPTLKLKDLGPGPGSYDARKPAAGGLLEQGRAARWDGVKSGSPYLQQQRAG